MSRRWISAWCALLALAGAREGFGVPPPLNPLYVRFLDDMEAIHFQPCDRLADQAGRYFPIEIEADYVFGRRPRFRVRARYPTPDPIVACVQGVLDRYRKVAPPYENKPDPLEPSVRRPESRTGGTLPFGEPARILPPWPELRAQLRASADGGEREQAIGPGLTTVGGRCLLTANDDDVVLPFFEWLESNFHQEPILDDDDHEVHSRFRIDATTTMVVRFGRQHAYVACPVAEGSPARRMRQLRAALGARGLLGAGLGRRQLWVAWTTGASRRAAEMKVCLQPADARRVARLRKAVAELLDARRLSPAEVGARFVAGFGPWHALSLERAGDGAGLPARCDFQEPPGPPTVE